jgi:hypothetical protein
MEKKMGREQEDIKRDNIELTRYFSKIIDDGANVVSND